MFARRLAADADVPFLLTSDGRSWTFRDLDQLAGRLAAALRERGVGDGDIVGLYQWNDTSWFVSALAVWRLGAVVACCGSVSPAAEAVRRFSLVRPRVVVSSEPAVLDGLTVITVDESGRPDGGDAGPGPEAGADPAVTPSPDQPAAIFFTSGTTGDAKPVVKVHGQFPEAARATATAYSRSPSFRPRMADSTKPPALGFNPFGQAACFGRLVFRLYIGRPLIQIRKFDVAVVQQLATRYDFDTLQLTPAMVHSLAFTDLHVSLGKLQYVSSGTAPLAPATRDEFERRYGVPVLQAYGSTEGGVTALERYDDVTAGRRGTGSVGRVTADSNWRIVRDDGADAAPGEEGEILGKPRNVTMAEAGISALPLDADGWYHTGDIGRVDEHGILYITGRVKDMLIVGGFNVYPGEVEDALRESPLVRDAMVVGLKDERLGEVPVAALVWNRAGARGRSEAAALAEVVGRARDLLAAYKVPRRWLTVEEIPLTPNGKPDRLALARLAEARSRSTADITGSGAAVAEGGTDGLRA
jgi:acyl-CoA synthetase (AMP-forming)/AMP-acid ligase II